MASMRRAGVPVAAGVAILLAMCSGARTTAQQPARGRPLAIEDYDRIQTVSSRRRWGQVAWVR